MGVVSVHPCLIDLANAVFGNWLVALAAQKQKALADTPSRRISANAFSSASE
jgi:hypothetical protein